MREGARRLLDLAGDAEVPELIRTEAVDKYVLRLDVPVKDVQLPADRERGTDVPPQRQHLLLAQGPLAHDVRKRREQLHADQNEPAERVGPLDEAVILDRDDVRRALERVHNADLAHKIADDALEIGAGPLVVHSFGSQRVDRGGIGRYLDDLDGGAAGEIARAADDLVNRSEGTPSDPAYDPPLGPDGFQQVVFVIHVKPLYIPIMRMLSCKRIRSNRTSGARLFHYITGCGNLSTVLPRKTRNPQGPDRGLRGTFFAAARQGFSRLRGVCHPRPSLYDTTGAPPGFVNRFPPRRHVPGRAEPTRPAGFGTVCAPDFAVFVRHARQVIICS